MCRVPVLKALSSTRSGENDVEYSGIMELEEGEIPDDVIGATGNRLFISQYRIASFCSSVSLRKRAWSKGTDRMNFYEYLFCYFND